MGPGVSGAVERLGMSDPLPNGLVAYLPFLWAFAFPEVPLLPNLYTSCRSQLWHKCGNRLPTVGQTYNLPNFFHISYAKGRSTSPFRPLAASSPEAGFRSLRGNGCAPRRWLPQRAFRPRSATTPRSAHCAPRRIGRKGRLSLPPLAPPLNGRGVQAIAPRNYRKGR